MEKKTIRITATAEKVEEGRLDNVKVYVEGVAADLLHLISVTVGEIAGVCGASREEAIHFILTRGHTSVGREVISSNLRVIRDSVDRMKGGGDQ